MVLMRLLSLVFIVLALMLLGADFVTTAEHRGGFVVRSLAQILALMGGDPTPWLRASLPAVVAKTLIAVLSWPGWLVLGLPGVLLAAISGQPK
jgi:hypothetical protein